MYTVKYYSVVKETGNPATCYNLDGLWGHFAKSEKDRYCTISLMWNKTVVEETRFVVTSHQGCVTAKWVNVVRRHRLPVISSVQSLSHVRLFATPWTAAHQASLSITNSWSLLKLMSIGSVTPFNHLILCHPLLLPSSVFPSIRVFSNESVLPSRWPK